MTARPICASLLCLVLACGAVLAANDGDAAAAVKARIDKDAAKFTSMTARIEWVDHTKVINEDSRQTGTVRLKRRPGAPPLGLINFTEPDQRTVALVGAQVQIYYPKMKLVRIFELGKESDQLFQFVLLGFGTTWADLNHTYTVKVAGADTVAGKKSTRLELKPKDPKALEYVTKVELWIPEDSGFPIQEVLYQPSGDTTTIRYSDIVINGPMTDAQLTLQLPSGVKKEYPQK